MNKPWKVMTILLFSGTLTLCSGVGCAGHTTKTTRTVATQEPAGAASADEMHEDNRTVTTTTTQDDERSPGIIGSTFRLVWAVISFPFRVIGDLV